MVNVASTKTQTLEDTREYLKQQIELLDTKIEKTNDKLHNIEVERTRIVVIMDNLNKLKEQ